MDTDFGPNVGAVEAAIREARAAGGKAVDFEKALTAALAKFPANSPRPPASKRPSPPSPAPFRHLPR
ncbi:hypothetical protein [Herbidospora cretacea]|uniref:hypothetical protein n=1 Tax=Herbidospora cretacea TaxID=28444 RepID=UPI0004C2BA2B|nr:hypothetical protein [Herbidospora cretacea]